MAKTYSLSIEKIPGLIEDFCKERNFIHCVVDAKDGRGWNAEFRKDSKDKPGILRLFFPSGTVSFQVQGNKAYASICNECQNYLIENASIPANDTKCLSVRNVSEEYVDILVEHIKEQEDISVRQKPNDAKNIKSTWEIEGKYNSRVRLTYFTNGTLTLQGPVTSLFVIVSTCMIEATQENPREIVKELFSLSNQQTDVISRKLSDHINLADRISGSLIEMQLNSSLSLINLGADLEDYSPCVFPALRALDAVMISFFVEEGGDAYKDYGEFFERKNGKGPYEFKEGCALFTDIALVGALEDAYNLFHEHRHSLFHVDKNNIETSRILDFAEALNLLKDILVIINRLYNNHK